MARLDYANARVGARRARLLGAGGLRELLARPSLEARLELLRGRPAGAALPAELGADPLAEIEAGLREGWRREAAEVLGSVEGVRPRALLEAFLGLEDAAALKAVLRAVVKGLSVERALAAAPPAAALPEPVLRAAAAAQSVEGAVAVLDRAGHPLAAALRPALPVAAEARLLALEISLDRAAVERARGACRRGREDGAVLLRHLEDRVDARNAATLLALAGAPPAADAFLQGGRRIGEPEFRRLAGAAVDTVRAGLARRFLAAEAALAEPASADAALERALVVPLRREARRRPLSLAVPLSYLVERRAEVRRVALVLRGAAIGVAAAELLELAEA